MKLTAGLLIFAFLLGAITGCAKAPEELPISDIGAPEPSEEPDIPVAAPALTPEPEPEPAPTPITFPLKGYCNGEGVNLRETPSKSAAIIDIMGENTALDLMALQDGWYKVNLGGTTAYVAEELITLGEPPRKHNMRWAKVIAKETQLYKTPGATDRSEIALKKDEIVKVLRTIGDYLHVVYEGKLQRYVKAKDVEYISAEEAQAEAAPASATPAP